VKAPIVFRASNDTSALFNTLKSRISGSLLCLRVGMKRFVHGGAPSRSGKMQAELQ
jgi:hypothetical protein